jgi:integrase
VLSGLGCRIGELLALHWASSIDFDHGTIYFHGTVMGGRSGTGPCRTTPTARRACDAGPTARQIADYLGHERISTTQEEYMERGVVVGSS